MTQYLCPDCEEQLPIPDYWGYTICQNCGSEHSYDFVVGYWQGRSSMIHEMCKLDELFESEVQGLEEMHRRELAEAKELYESLLIEYNEYKWSNSG